MDEMEIAHPITGKPRLLVDGENQVLPLDVNSLQLRIDSLCSKVAAKLKELGQGRNSQMEQELTDMYMDLKSLQARLLSVVKGE